jgi:hypothetical protein
MTALSGGGSFRSVEDIESGVGVGEGRDGGTGGRDVLFFLFELRQGYELCSPNLTFGAPNLKCTQSALFFGFQGYVGASARDEWTTSDVPVPV